MKVIIDNGPVKNSSTPSEIPVTKQTQGTGIKILTPKRILQRLATALAQAKAGCTSKNILKFVISYNLCITQKKLLNSI